MNQRFGTGLRKFAPVLTMVSLTAAAGSDDADRHMRDAEEPHWDMGLGVQVKKSPYVGVGAKTTALPVLSYESRWVRAFGNQLDLKLPSYGPLSFSVRTQFPVGEGYKASDSPRLAGMGERKAAVLVGVASSWRSEMAEISLALLKDVSGHSRGTIARLGAEQTFRLGSRTALIPHAELFRYDAKYVDYYYGVKVGEAIPGRPRYSGRAAGGGRLGIRVLYALDRQQRLFVDMSRSQLGAGVVESPIVERKGEDSVRAGYSYSF